MGGASLSIVFQVATVVVLVAVVIFVVARRLAGMRRRP
jgi:hypothetical protein